MGHARHLARAAAAALLLTWHVAAAAINCPTGSSPGAVQCALGVSAPTPAAVTALNAGRNVQLPSPPTVSNFAAGSLCVLIAYPCTATVGVAQNGLNVLSGSACGTASNATVYLASVVGWTTCANDLASYSAIPNAVITPCWTGTGCNLPPSSAAPSATPSATPSASAGARVGAYVASAAAAAAVALGMMA